jgi:butyryl-CoA dehydrogenase
MKLELTEEQQMIQAMAREFAQKDVAPIAAEIDREARFPHETVTRMGELGLLGIVVPEAWGGSGADVVAYVVALEEVARACASHAVIMSVNNSLYCDPVYTFGTEAQRTEFLRPAASGREIGCFALTEPEAGSDATNQNTLAVRDGDAYVLNGRKIFVTNGREAAAALVFCQTDRARRHRGISAFLVRKGTPGFQVVKTEDKLGIRASDTAEFLFTDCRVPVACRLGEEGQGFRIAMTSLDGGRIGIAAQALGIAAGAYERARAYARERHAFGVPIGHHQMVQWMLADMATAIEAARLLTLRAAALKDAGRPYGVAAAQAKLFASETAMTVATNAVQVHGGYGFIKEYEVERYFRDAKITQIYEGTSQIQKLVIARDVLGGASWATGSAGSRARTAPSRLASPSGRCASSRCRGSRSSPCTARRAWETGRTPRSSAIPGTTRSRGACTRRCTGAACGRCGCSPASGAPPIPTRASSTCSRRGRPASPPPSTCRP